VPRKVEQDEYDEFYKQLTWITSRRSPTLTWSMPWQMYCCSLSSNRNAPAFAPQRRRLALFAQGPDPEYSKDLLRSTCDRAGVVDLEDLP
jgi:hypothetical protein